MTNVTQDSITQTAATIERVLGSANRASGLLSPGTITDPIATKRLELLAFASKGRVKRSMGGDPSTYRANLVDDQVVAVPVHRSDWQHDARNAAAGQAINLDQNSVEAATDAVIDSIDELVFDGDSDLGIVGLKAAAVNGVNVSEVSAAGGGLGALSGDEFIEPLAEAVEALTNNGYTGELACVLHSSLRGKTLRDYTENYPRTLASRIAELFGPNVAFSNRLADAANGDINAIVFVRGTRGPRLFMGVAPRADATEERSFELAPADYAAWAIATVGIPVSYQGSPDAANGRLPLVQVKRAA